MKPRHLKYLLVFSLPALVSISLTSTGWLTYLPLLYSFAAIPMLELFFRPDSSNLSRVEADVRKKDRTYDYLLYAIVPVQWGFLMWFLFSVSEPNLSLFDLIGRISAMGLMCGVLGINVAHELGHRVKPCERVMAKALLLTSLYMHFYIEHNRGHHKNVSTKNDPSSARKNEALQVFWVRSVFTGYISAWKLELARLKKKKKWPWGLENEMTQFSIIQVFLLGLIIYFFSYWVFLYFIVAAVIGILLLETVNYIEHYGLERKKVSDHRYERASPLHSWNSDHIIGRLMLFELSRHSDHHYMASKKYQILDHHNNSPQMPTGYPGMIILALFPPLWFWVMNKRISARLNKGRN